MAANIWRFIPLDVNHGAFQMATDVVLATSEPKQPILRFYLWEPYTLSIGHHQSTDLVDLESCKESQIDVVRRPTGGRAIFHSEELTYMVVLPGSHPVAEGNVQDVHNRISEALANGLKKLELPVMLNAEAPNLREHYKNETDSFSCFSTTTRYELQVEGKKVVGSAQRKYPNAILQHGSILIGSAHRRLPEFLRLDPDDNELMKAQFEEKTTELDAHLPESITPFGLSHALADGFREYFECDFETEPLTEPETKRIRDIQSKFSIFASGEVHNHEH